MHRLQRKNSKYFSTCQSYVSFKFWIKKSNFTLQFSLNFWPNDKMADSLLLAVLYEFTLKFIKNEKDTEKDTQIQKQITEI